MIRSIALFHSLLLRPFLHAVALVAGTLAPASAALALEPATARATVETLHDGLVHIMSNGPELGMSGRAAYIDDVVDATYNLRVLTAQAIGPSAFRALSEEEQADIVAAYRSFVISNYARQFSRPGPVGFETRDVSPGPGAALIVNTALTRPSGDPVALSYVVTETAAGEVGIVDVLHNGVSESARRRSEFGPIAAKGAGPLARAIRSKAEELGSEPE